MSLKLGSSHSAPDMHCLAVMKMESLVLFSFNYFTAYMLLFNSKNQFRMMIDGHGFVLAMPYVVRYIDYC